MKHQRIASPLIAAALTALALGALIAPAAAKPRSGNEASGRSFHGKVAAIFPKQRAFTVDRTSGSTIKFYVRPSTTYEHIKSFANLKKGVPVEVHAINRNNRWIATKVETNPGNSGNGSDNPPGDDNSSGGHGADDANQGSSQRRPLRISTTFATLR